MVIGIDLTEYSEIVLEHALDQAARHTRPELHFIHVKEQRKRSTEDLSRRLASIVYPGLQTFSRHAMDWWARLHVRTGKPAEQIAGLAQDLMSDLIVIGQFGLHHPRQTFKTLPGRVLQAAPCPTLIVGMPMPIDISQCPACSAVREDTEGERWFCAEHSAPDRIEHAVTPMTVWTGGSLMW